MKKNITFLFLLSIIFSSFGQVVVTDNFTYPDGNLVGNGTWVAHSADGIIPVQVLSNQIYIVHGGGSREDVNIPFTEITTGAVYASFDFKVPALSGSIAGSDYEYFAHFSDGGTSFRGRVDIVSPSGSGDFSVGISSASGTAEATWPTDLLYDTTYKVIIKYDIATGQAQLWVDASAESDASISGTTGIGVAISNFSFRQATSTSNETIIVDNLIVSKSFASTLSTQEFELGNTFSLYPNPAKNSSRISFQGLTSEKVYVSVFDVLGKEVISKTITSNTLDISSLTTGVYLVKVKQDIDGVMITKKLIVN